MHTNNLKKQTNALRFAKKNLSLLHHWKQTISLKCNNIFYILLY